MPETKWIDLTDVAKYIRKVLAKEFPSQQFSVRSERYAGGSSITIRWTDGPTTEEVNEHVKFLAGKGFDGSIDMDYYNEHWLLPDGTITYAGTGGTEDSKGSVSSAKIGKPHPKAERVHIGCGYIFTNRELSRQALEIGVDYYTSHCHQAAKVVVDGRTYPYLKSDSHDACETIRRYLSETSFYARPETQAAAPVADNGELPSSTDQAYYRGTWTWLKKLPQQVDEATQSALDAAGFQWSKRRSQWYAESIVTDLTFLNC